MKKLLVSVGMALALISCSDYGTKVTNGNIEVYYKEGINKEEAEHTAAVLRWIDSAVNNASATKSLQLQKPGDTIMLRMVANEAQAASLANDAFLSLANIISDSVFSGRPVAVDLTSNTFETIRHIPYQKLAAADADYGQQYVNGNVEVYYRDGVTEAEAKKMQAYLLESMQPESLISFQMNKTGNGIMSIKMASTKEQAQVFTEAALTSMAREISESQLNGAPLQFAVTDEFFTPLQTGMYQGK